MVNPRKKVLARLGFELMTFAFEYPCSITELRNPSYFFDKKLQNTPIFFEKRGQKNLAPQMSLVKRHQDEALGLTLYSSALTLTFSGYNLAPWYVQPHYGNHDFPPLANSVYLIVIIHKTLLCNGNCPIMNPITEMRVGPGIYLQWY